METLFLLVPLSLILAALIAGALWWALHAGQYDDLDRPAEAILLDNDRPASPRPGPPPPIPQKSSSHFSES
ncbi:MULTISPECIES: cbb3-type cytochrome oxidase assembly protein CcoS [unclassified Cupriavidus]|uniref:cbb3-type cytochrome oxidase assembly protein CcoS n=1 Tax=Cupriavidus sp. H19C3 TaxID=3241603 RepID=UPI003BF8E9E8